MPVCASATNMKILYLLWHPDWPTCDVEKGAACLVAQTSLLFLHITTFWILLLAYISIFHTLKACWTFVVFIHLFQSVALSQGPPPSLLLLSSSSSSSIPPPHIFPVRCCCCLRVLRAAQRGHGGLSQRDEEDLFGAGDQTAGQVRLQPCQDLRQRPMAAVEILRLCR